MNYAIDNDSLRVLVKHESKEVLGSFVEDNSLELAISIVSSPDDLELEFTLKEVMSIGINLGMNERLIPEDEASLRVFGAIRDVENDIPDFSIKKAKKQFRISEERSSDKTEEIHEPAPKKEKAPRKKVEYDFDAEVKLIDGKCKSGSILATIVTAIEEEFCSTLGEVRAYILENHVIPKTGELADEKFADHNIKYFLSQGKISVGDDL